jgi:hypothetical protein
MQPPVTVGAFFEPDGAVIFRYDPWAYHRQMHAGGVLRFQEATPFSHLINRLSVARKTFERFK